MTMPISQFKYLLLSFLLLPIFAQAQLSPKEIDQLMEKALKAFHVAGASIAIVKDGKVLMAKGYGVKSILSSEPADENTNFQIASNSKAFTTAALAILVDEGKLAWTDKVVKIIPEFKMYNDYVTANFTIEDLLSHRSGLGPGAGDLMLFPEGSDFTITDIARNFQYFKPTSAFRTHFQYDNKLYLVAGEVVARLSGMSWEAFVQQRILDPLQMSNSSASLASLKDKISLASPHSTATDTLKVIARFGDMINGAAGGIVSNANDMSKWLLMHLNSGSYGTTPAKQLFTELSHKQMWTIHTVEEANWSSKYNTHFSGYGMGWALCDIKGNLSVSHAGGLPGMLSIVHMIPDLKLGIVILTNTEDGGTGVFSAVSQTIIDSYLGLKDAGWIRLYAAMWEAQKNPVDSISQKVWEKVALEKTRPINKEDFVGIYEDKWFGKVEVFVKDGQLWFKCCRSPKLSGPMSFYKDNTFAIKWEYQQRNADAFAIFSTDSAGKAQSIKMKGISPYIDNDFDFQDLDLQRVGR